MKKKRPEGKDGLFLYNPHKQIKTSLDSHVFFFSFPMMSTTHLDFGAIEAHIAVHSMERDGVELALVQVDHGQLVGFVR